MIHGLYGYESFRHIKLTITYLLQPMHSDECEFEQGPRRRSTLEKSFGLCVEKLYLRKLRYWPLRPP